MALPQNFLHNEPNPHNKPLPGASRFQGR